MEYDEEKIQKEFNDLADLVELEIRKRARAILRRYRSLGEFVKGMGGWFFTDNAGNILYDAEADPRFDSVRVVVERWDGHFHLTGTPIRFTARGPDVTNW